MSRRLCAPTLTERSRTLSAPSPALDETTQAAVDAAVADAYARGLSDGRREGLEAATVDHAAAVAALEAAIGAAAAALRSARKDQADALADLALVIAQQVVGREPHDGGLALLNRVREALETIDDGPLIVHANPQDLEVLLAGLGGLDLQVVPDPAMAAGEARVTGRWATADLTQQAAWDALAEVLGR